MHKNKKKKIKTDISLASLTAAGTALNPTFGVRSDLLATLMRICSFSSAKFGFTPTIEGADCYARVLSKNQTGFAIFITNPPGSTPTDAAYIDALRAELGTQYSVAPGVLYISVEFQPAL
jgi:hypothetical protein